MSGLRGYIFIILCYHYIIISYFIYFLSYIFRKVSLLCRGTPDQLIDFCYMVYDINGDKSLAREELSHCLKGGLVPYAGVMNGDEIEEAMREIVEIVIYRSCKYHIEIFRINNYFLLAHKNRRA